MYPTWKHLKHKAYIHRPNMRNWMQHSNRQNFNIPHSSMERSSRQKINKETWALNNILDQIDS